jgi:hypothetical protein
MVEPFISIACGAFIYAQFSSKYQPQKINMDKSLLDAQLFSSIEKLGGRTHFLISL